MSARERRTACMGHRGPGSQGDAEWGRFEGDGKALFWLRDPAGPSTALGTRGCGIHGGLSVVRGDPNLGERSEGGRAKGRGPLRSLLWHNVTLTGTPALHTARVCAQGPQTSPGPC